MILVLVLLFLWIFAGLTTYFHLLINPRKGLHPRVARELRGSTGMIVLCIMGVGSVVFAIVPVEWINESYAELINENGGGK